MIKSNQISAEEVPVGDFTIPLSQAEVLREGRLEYYIELLELAKQKQTKVYRSTDCYQNKILCMVHHVTPTNQSGHSFHTTWRQPIDQNTH